ASLVTGCGGSKDASGDAGKEGSGKVYYLNFKPEADAAWQDLAAKYTEETGVEVKVVTAASGEYENTLTTEMGKSNAPTLFQVGNETALATWEDYIYDLADTDVYKEMSTTEYNLEGDNGEVYAIAYCYESFGIITNKALLKEAGYEVSDIKDFESLKTIVEDITARKDELGFAAFSSAGLDDSSAWRFTGHLANMPLFYEFRDDKVEAQPATVTGAYLDNFKNIWDLYINNATCEPAQLATKTGDESEAEFGQGKAVFYQNGTWEYSNLVLDESKGFKMNPDDLTMIPLYCGVDGEEESGLCNGTENCWAVNSQASEADIQATLDFLKWVVTSDEGTSMMAEQFGAVPFKQAKEATNVFCEAANQCLADGKYNVTWAFNYTPNVDQWRAGVKSALLQYSANGGDWADVEKAYVDGWAAQYKAQ
ncbi:MAG: ABC transporter substrate-binding protein, partial [bacterium]|nr:ABC transporter substrate-binding protein [bacterium]